MDFFGDSTQLQTSPILLFWNWNRFLEKRVFDTINLWNRNCLLDLRVQKLRIGLAWSCVESYRLVKDHQHEKIRIKSEA